MSYTPRKKMYPNLKDNKFFGYGLNKDISSQNVEKMFTHHETGKMINYKVDNDLFLKSSINNDKQNYILKIFGGSTSFCTQVNQEDYFFEKSFSQIATQKDFYYKNYAIPGHNILHDYNKIKNFNNKVDLNLESVFVFNHGWNEEFANSVFPSALHNVKPFNAIESNFIYQKNFILSKLCKNPYLATLIRKFTHKRFIRLMNFYGVERWTNFVNNNYINFWLYNLEKIFRLIPNKKVIIINNPGLAHLSDTSENIDFIIENSRLNKKYHLYQSLCLEINSIVNNHIATFFEIPIIDLNLEFKKMNSKKRLEYFFDEIHFSTKGHELISGIMKKNFLNLDLKKIKKIDKKDFNDLKLKIIKDIEVIINIAKREIYKNFSISKKIYSIPRDRYPSYNFSED